MRIFFVKIILALSGTAVTVLYFTSDNRFAIIALISFELWCFLLFRTGLFNNIFSGHFSKPRFLLSLIASAQTAYYWLINRHFVYILYEIKTMGELIQIRIPIVYNTALKLFLGILILTPALFAFLYWFYGILYQMAQECIRDIKKYEKVYLLIIIEVIIISIITVFAITSVFYEPKLINGPILFDVVFTTDSYSFFLINTYMNILTWQNDIRQPLFGLFAIPFSVFPFIISILFSYIPGIYPILLQIVQVILLQISVVMLSRTMRMRGISVVVFCIMLSLSYPYLLFTFNPEQYILPVFYMFLLFYLYLKKDTIFIKNGREMFFIASAGSLLTNAILFPCTITSKGIKALKELFRLGIVFLLVVFLCGQLNILLGAFPHIGILLQQFGGTTLTFSDRLLQYFNFIALCIIKPDIIIHEFYGAISYHLAPVTSLNYPGVLFFIFTIVSFLLNRKNKLAQICIVWVAYSFIVLCIIGWGTGDNGLVLYSLYFSWGFFILLFMGLEKILEKFTLLKYCVYGILIILLIFINIPAIYDLIRFGIDYYPNH